MTRKSITGIILAGGQSRRMGSDKGLIVWQGKPFVQHIIEALQAVTEEVIIISNQPQYQDFGCPCYTDMIPDKGPLGGLYTGLFHSKSSHNIVLSCDVPLVSPPLLQLLIDAISPSTEAVQLVEEAQSHPLIACYHQSVLPIIENQLQMKKRSMKALISRLRVQSIAVAPLYQKCLFNINDQQDLAKLQGLDEER